MSGIITPQVQPYFPQMFRVKKYVSPFVFKMKALDGKKKPQLVWNSATNGTYRKKQHGNLD